jgi:threonine/homoserine/homoserine lactone efflux protein
MELLLTIALIHLIACLSPGPDIFLVVLNSLRDGWRAGAATTAGILTGVCLHVTLGITGISLILTRGAAVQHGVALAGASWLVYLGANSWRSAPPGPGNVPAATRRPARRGPWLQGLLVNLLNPKAMLFFLSLFSVLLGPEVPLRMKVAAGLTMIAVQAAAFTAVALLVDRPGFKARWAHLQGWLERAIGAILIALGAWIWVRTLATIAG